MRLEELTEEIRRCREAIRYLAKVIDKLNGSQNTPDNHYDETEHLLHHE
jgi:hypothetical protein